MTAPRFYGPSQPLDLDGLLALTGARLREPSLMDIRITGVATLDWAGPRDLCVAAGADQAEALRRCQAGACVVGASIADLAPSSVVILIADDPLGAFARAAAALFPFSIRPQPLYGPGVSAGASIHPEARLEPGVSVDPGAVVGPGAEIGRGAVIGANAVIGTAVRIGRDAAVGAGAVVENALIGDRVVIHAGASVGHKAGSGPASGRVVIQDGVEIGPNASVARGGLGDTVVGEGAIVGPLASVGSDAMIGRHCVICALSSLDAGARLGDFAIHGARDASDAETCRRAATTA